VSPIELTAIGALLVSVLSAVVLPLLFKQQTAKQLKIEREETARQLKGQDEKAAIKEQAKQDAAKTAGDVVSWEGMNRALRATAQEASAAHQEQIARLREDFAAETARLKRQNDYDLDRANKKIGELADQVQTLERRLAGPGLSGEK
jgi:hypothetical protein